MPQVTIDAEVYKELLEKEEILSRLYAGGVDNWDGYSDCFDDEEDEDE